MWKEIITLFQAYMGKGLIVGWFLLSVVYLLVQEKRKNIRILFVYAPILLLLVFFNPLFAKIIYTMVDTEIYYRVLWLIPMTPVIAYAAAQLYNGLRGKVRIAFAAACVALIMVSGSYIYQDLNFHRAENLYHMPQSVVDICDAIEIEGREVTAAFPLEMLQFVRQYSPVICMPYGREQLVGQWNFFRDFLYLEMEKEVIDAAELARLSKEASCHYVILHEGKQVKGDLLAYDFVLFDKIDGYLIYKDTTMNFTLEPR